MLKIQTKFNLAKSNKHKFDNKSKTIFHIKKYHRNGLHEKKVMLNKKLLGSGKWTTEEHTNFIRGILKYGSKWKKLKEEIKTRTHAQIRSHAQKYFIKLCKRYNIEIRSKRKENFSLDHLNFPYKRKTDKYILPLDKISKIDLILLKSFKFYVKKVDLAAINSPPAIFGIKKVKREKVSLNNQVDISEQTANNSKNMRSSIIEQESASVESPSLRLLNFLTEIKVVNNHIIEFLRDDSWNYNQELKTIILLLNSIYKWEHT